MRRTIVGTQDHFFIHEDDEFLSKRIIAPGHIDAEYNSCITKFEHDARDKKVVLEVVLENGEINIL